MFSFDRQTVMAYPVNPYDFQRGNPPLRHSPAIEILSLSPVNPGQRLFERVVQF